MLIRDNLPLIIKTKVQNITYHLLHLSPLTLSLSLPTSLILGQGKHQCWMEELSTRLRGDTTRIAQILVEHGNPMG